MNKKKTTLANELKKYDYDNHEKKTLSTNNM